MNKHNFHLKIISWNQFARYIYFLLYSRNIFQVWINCPFTTLLFSIEVPKIMWNYSIFISKLLYIARHFHGIFSKWKNTSIPSKMWPYFLLRAAYVNCGKKTKNNYLNWKYFVKSTYIMINLTEKLPANKFISWQWKI